MAKAIIVDNLSKAYQIGQIGTGTVSKDLERWWTTRIRGKEDPFLKIGETNDRAVKGESDIVWSLKDINFQIEQGDAVGIIGRNGAGKSTLLKVLSEVTSPTTGRINIKGRIASLLEVGTGFHPELTGRENIYLNGAILGMRKKEIARKLDEIIDFSGVARYIDTPVKRYSSGMYVRLAFAVAAHLESEILIVDEVLAVGDAEFQKKCLGKMGDVSKEEGRTILFVSHNLAAVTNLCTKGIVLSNGKCTFQGLSSEAVGAYMSSLKSWSNNFWVVGNKQSKEVFFSEINTELRGDQPILILDINFKLTILKKDNSAFVAFDIKNSLEIAVLQAIPENSPFISIDGISKEYKCSIELNGLIPGRYSVSCWIGAHNTHTYDFVENALSFDVINGPIQNRTYPYNLEHGNIISKSNIL